MNDDQNQPVSPSLGGNQNSNPNDQIQPLQQPSPGSSPISNPAKEAQPFYDNQSSKDSYIEVSEKEPEIKPEVENAGVVEVSDRIKLSNSERAAGLMEAKESTPVITQPSDRIKLPMTTQEATVAEKGSPNNSMTWLAKLVLLYLKKMGGGSNA